MGMKLFKIIFLFLIFLSLLAGGKAYAQLPPIQDVIQTIVGNANVGSGSIVSWATRISSGLEKVCDIYNRQQQIISNGRYSAKIRPGTCKGEGSPTYFCTNTVIDSYNLAGFSNSFSQSVYYMARGWEKRGWTVLKTNDYSSLSRLLPGDAIFMGLGANGMDIYGIHHHTVIIAGININSAGDGRLHIAQSNGPSKYPNTYYTVRGWRISTCYYNSCPTDWWFGLYPR